MDGGHDGCDDGGENGGDDTGGGESGFGGVEIFSLKKEGKILSPILGLVTVPLLHSDPQAEFGSYGTRRYSHFPKA